jgi:hypothetical protein
MTHRKAQLPLAASYLSYLATEAPAVQAFCKVPTLRLLRMEVRVYESAYGRGKGCSGVPGERELDPVHTYVLLNLGGGSIARLGIGN